MVFQWVFYFSLLILSCVFFGVIVKKYRVEYIYLFFQFSLVAMINLDGFKLDNSLFSSLDIIVTAFFSMVFLVAIILFQTKFYMPFVLYVGYLVNALIGVYFSPVVAESIKYISRQAFFLLLMLILMNYKMSLKKIDELLVLWFKFSVIPAFIALIQVATRTGLHTRADLGNIFFTRGMGLTSHPNFLAYYLMMTLLIFLIVHAQKNLDIKKSTVVVITIIDLIAFMFTFCRGALIGLFIGCFLYFWTVNKKKLIVLPFVFSLTFFIPGVGTKILEMFNFSKLLTDSSFSWRLAYWRSILRLMNWDNIWLGNGIKSTKYYLNKSPHNEYIGFLFENGILGFTVFYGFLIVLLILYRKNYYKVEAPYKCYFLAGWILVVVSLVVAMSDNYFMVPSTVYYFWFFNGLLLNIHFSLKENSKAVTSVQFE